MMGQITSRHNPNGPSLQVVKSKGKISFLDKNDGGVENPSLLLRAVIFSINGGHKESSFWIRITSELTDQ
ncbi:hypothetical protein HAX54_010302 [Datura stramonium]|uniref:Uncharacterized protein n=1 Tax=Datura stramonium TaxID=4076 RepID=A0ABS8WZW1_DATST|nr:hypothetical protein [Datura stramonium]